MEPITKPRAAMFVVLILGLLAATAGLAELTATTMSQARQGEQALGHATTTPAEANSPASAERRKERSQQQYLVRMSWLFMCSTAVTVLMLAWISVRFIISILEARKAPLPKHGPYEDAWKLAGERFKLDEHKDLDPKAEEEDNGGPENEDEDDNDEPGKRKP